MSNEAVHSAGEHTANGAPQQAPDGGVPGGGRPSGPTPQPETRSARMAWIIIISTMVLGAGLGALVYFRASAGSLEIGHELKAIRAQGVNLEAEACVGASLDWYQTACDAPGKMCIDAVPRLVGECLAAKDRTDACVRLGNAMKPSQWAYEHCKERGIDRSSKRPLKESCTQAWRALDSYCKSGQKGVAL